MALQTDLLKRQYKDNQNNTACKIKTVARLFDDVPLDAAAHRAIAEILHKFDHNDSAEEECLESLRKSEDNVERFKTLVLLAHVQRSVPQNQDNNDPGKVHVGNYTYMQNMSNKAYERSHRTIEQALATASFPEDLNASMLVHQALVLRADCEMQLGLFAKAVCSIQEARSALSDVQMTREDDNVQMKGDALALLPLSIAHTGHYEQIFDKINDWSFLEYMAWLIYDFDSSGHLSPNTIFQRAAKASGHEYFATKIYQQIIACLEPRGAAGYIQVCLGDFYYHVISRTEEAKSIWLQVWEITASRQ